VLGEVVNHTRVGASEANTSSGELRNRGDLLERHAWIATPDDPGPTFISSRARRTPIDRRR